MPTAKRIASCAQCGAPLPADISAAICPKCELRGALSVFEESAQLAVGDETAAEKTANLAADLNPAAHRDLDRPGRRQFGDYELKEEIARGGMGVVYRARQISLDRIVAVKMLLAGRLANKDFVQRFRTESAAAASLQHPNIVAIHEVGFAEGQHFFAMEYVEGLTLAQLIAKGPLPPARAAKYVQTTAAAIHFAHERNVLHRDLKPSNVMIDSATDQPRVTDFGLAKRLESETELTLTGQLLGSPNFMSPEQATAKRGAVGKRSDVYSLGAILYYLLTARPPFQGETVSDVLQQVIHSEPLAPHLLTSRIPHDLETVCLKCLEKEPGARYQTAQELADELTRYLEDKPILARQVTPFERGWRWCRRKPALAGLGFSLLIVFGLGFTGTLWQWRHAARYAQAEAEQRQLAEKNRDLAVSKGDLADQNIYDSDMSLAQHAWDEGDFGRTRNLLEAHRPGPGQLDRRDFEWFYLRQLSAGDQRWTSPTHIQAVSAVAFSPDGKRMAVGAAGSPVEIWDCATEKLITTIPEQNVVSLAFGPDAQTLGVGGQDQVIVWDLETRRALFTHEEALSRYRIALSPLGSLLVLGKHGGLRIFGKDGGSVELWDYRTKELKATLPESGGYVALSPRGDKLATGNWKQTIKIWDLATRQLVRTLPAGSVVDMTWSSDGQTLATCLWGELQVKLWNVSRGLPIDSLTGNRYRIWSLAFSPDGKFFATGGADQAVHLWDLGTRQEIEQLRGHGSGVTSLAFSPDSRTLFSGSKDKRAMLWNVHPNRTISTVSNICSRPTFSADGRFVAAGTERGGVAVWDVATLQIQAAFPGARDALAFSGDGHTLVTRGTNYFLRTFDVATPTIRETVPDGPVAQQDDQGKLSPDGKVLAIGVAEGTITFFDAKTGHGLGTIPHAFASNIFQLAFSPSGKLLAGSGREVEAGRVPAAKVWDVASQKRVALLAGHTDTVLGIAFSPDNKTLATSGSDNSIKFWDLATGKEIFTFLGHKEYVISVALSPNGRRLASASTDGSLKIWNVVTHREVTSLKFDGWPSHITFAPDGQTLAAMINNSIHLWRAPVGDDEPPRIDNAPQ